jgi:hypothetical protein
MARRKEGNPFSASRQKKPRCQTFIVGLAFVAQLNNWENITLFTEIFYHERYISASADTVVRNLSYGGTIIISTRVCQHLFPEIYKLILQYSN